MKGKKVRSEATHRLQDFKDNKRKTQKAKSSIKKFCRDYHLFKQTI